MFQQTSTHTEQDILPCFKGAALTIYVCLSVVLSVYLSVCRAVCLSCCEKALAPFLFFKCFAYWSHLKDSDDQTNFTQR